MAEMKRSVGRPRDPKTDALILEAARAVLTEQGYEALSYEVVARRAGVTRPTIYRRWPSKVQLAYEAAFPAADLQSITYTGDLRTDLGRLIEAAARAYSRPETRAALPALLPHLMPGSVLREAARDPLTAAARRQFRAVLDQAARRGQIRPDVDADLIFDTVVGLVMFRVALQGEWPSTTPDEAVDLILRGASPSG